VRRVSAIQKDTETCRKRKTVDLHVLCATVAPDGRFRLYPWSCLSSRVGAVLVGARLVRSPPLLDFLDSSVGINAVGVLTSSSGSGLGVKQPLLPQELLVSRLGV
jgi:hypothetical protein